MHLEAPNHLLKTSRVMALIRQKGCCLSGRRWIPSPSSCGASGCAWQLLQALLKTSRYKCCSSDSAKVVCCADAGLTVTVNTHAQVSPACHQAPAAPRPRTWLCASSLHCESITFNRCTSQQDQQAQQIRQKLYRAAACHRR